MKQCSGLSPHHVTVPSCGEMTDVKQSVTDIYCKRQRNTTNHKIFRLQKVETVQYTQNKQQSFQHFFVKCIQYKRLKTKLLIYKCVTIKRFENSFKTMKNHHQLILGKF